MTPHLGKELKSIVEDVERIVHAFPDEGRRQATRDLAKRVQEGFETLQKRFTEAEQRALRAEEAQFHARRFLLDLLEVEEDHRIAKAEECARRAEASRDLAHCFTLDLLEGIGKISAFLPIERGTKTCEVPGIAVDRMRALELERDAALAEVVILRMRVAETKEGAAVSETHTRGLRVSDRFPGSTVLPHGREVLVSFPTGGGVLVSDAGYLVVGVEEDEVMKSKIRAALGAKTQEG